MARPVKQAPLEGRGQRRRLKPGRQAHWRTITPGRVHLGYQRWAHEREGRWIVRRYLEGKYRVSPVGIADDLRDADGRAVLSYEQAHAAAVEIADEPAAKTHRLTVRVAMTNYIEFKRAQGQSVTDLISRSHAWIVPTLGDRVVAELSAATLRKWLASMAAMPAMKRSALRAEQAYKAEPESDEDVRRRRASANRVLAYLKAALNHAFDEGDVPRNDAWGRKLKPFRGVEIARVRYLSVAEATRLINAADPDFRPLLRAALETGARYSELARLEVADFNPDAGTINIRKSKSSKARHVVLTDQGCEFFAEICAGRPGGETLLGRAGGGRWGASLQARPMADACGRAGIDPPVGIHQLRHTWASHAVMNGVPLMVVAKNLGHADTRMVEKHYGHLAPSYIADEIRRGAPRFGVVVEKKIVPMR